MRCSDLQRKPVEIGRNDLSTRESLTKGFQLPWQAGGKARFIYLPPGLMLAQVKFPLIDLELLTDNAEEDKAQAFERMAA